MQATRQRILELLRDARIMTVEELAGKLELTPVTVRHHLDILKDDGLVEIPQVRRRQAPGRPQYTFQLTPAAQAYFPRNYQLLSNLMLTEIRDSMSQEQQDRMISNIAARMAAEAAIPGPHAAPEERLQAAVQYLNTRGYVAEWLREPDGGYILRTRNCPYHEVSHDHTELCSMDVQLVVRLLGAGTLRREQMSLGDHCCSYVLSVNQVAA